MKRLTLTLFTFFIASFAYAEDQLTVLKALNAIHTQHGIYFTVEYLHDVDNAALLGQKIRYDDLKELKLGDLRDRLRERLDIRIDGADHAGAVWRITEAGIVDNPLDTVLREVNYDGVLSGLITIASQEEPSIQVPMAWIAGGSFRNQVDLGTLIHIERSTPIAIHDLFTMAAPRKNAYPILWYAKISNPRDDEERFCVLVFCGELRKQVKLREVSAPDQVDE